MRLITLFLLSTLLLHCGRSSKDESPTDATLPKALPSTANELFLVNDSMFVNNSLLIQVDLFGTWTPNTGANSIPTCRGYLPHNFVLGRVSCEDGSAQLDLQARHVLQFCSHNAELQQPPQENLRDILTCSGLKVELFDFEPTLCMTLVGKKILHSRACKPIADKA